MSILTRNTKSNFLLWLLSIQSRTKTWNFLKTRVFFCLIKKALELDTIYSFRWCLSTDTGLLVSCFEIDTGVSVGVGVRGGKAVDLASTEIQEGREPEKHGEMLLMLLKYGTLTFFWWKLLVHFLNYKIVKKLGTIFVKGLSLEPRSQ